MTRWLVLALVAMGGMAWGSAPTVPRALAPGDTIALIAPSSPTSREKAENVATALAAMGFKTRIAANVGERTGYLAGSDEARAAELMAAWRDPEVDAIFSLQGGYGAMRYLDDLDYDHIRAHPKIFTGFSDITALLLAFNQRANLVVYHAPTTEYVLGGMVDERPFATRSFWQTVYPDGPLGGGSIVYTDDGLSSPILTLRPGRAQGRLTGGSLTLVHALMGTEYEIETEGRLLFLEDVGESPYRIDRMLMTLELAGKLEAPAGVILGLWHNCDTENPERSFTLAQVFEDYFGGRPYPVVSQFPVGHVRENATLPVGVLAELDADAGRLTLLESPVRRD